MRALSACAGRLWRGLSAARRAPLLIAYAALGVVHTADLGAQSGPTRPVLRATRAAADIRIGGMLLPGAWHVEPRVPLDTYIVRNVGAGRPVTIYTDRDSLAVLVTRGSSFDFVVVLNGDSAYSRITTIDPDAPIPGAVRADTIPFTFGRHGKIYVRASINGSAPLSLMFDTGADQVVLSEAGRRRATPREITDSSHNAAFGGTFRVGRSVGNVLRLGRMEWKNVPVLLIDAADGDGILGHNVFDDRVVTIDVDRQRLIVGDAGMPRPANASVLRVDFANGLMFVPARLRTERGTYVGQFELDTGSEGALLVDHRFRMATGIGAGLPTMDVRSHRGLGDGVVHSDLVRLAEVQFGTMSLLDVPTDLARASNEQQRGAGLIGIDVLQRFNMILDLREHTLTVWPSARWARPYRHRSPVREALVAGVVLAVAVAGIATMQRRRERRDRP